MGIRYRRYSALKRSNARIPYTLIPLYLYTFILLTSILHLTCGVNLSKESVIRIKGSDTMLYLTKTLAEEYMKRKPGASIYVEGGGTASGIKALVDGEINICTASRPLKGEEIKLLAEHFGTVGISYIIAKDALTIFINPKNRVKNLSLFEIKNIFLGKIKSWKEVGGNDSPIEVIIRNPNSGTYLYFKEHVLNGEDYTPDAVVKPTTQSIIDEVLASGNAVGYGGIGYQMPSTNLKVDGIAPTEENVQNDSYPIARYLYFYTYNSPSGTLKDFIDWVIGQDGQTIIKKTGFIPLWTY